VRVGAEKHPSHTSLLSVIFVFFSFPARHPLAKVASHISRQKGSFDCFVVVVFFTAYHSQQWQITVILQFSFPFGLYSVICHKGSFPVD